MEHYLAAGDKFDIQQNFRRYMRLKERHDAIRESYKHARASKVWIAGIIALLLALGSDFFLGAAAGLFGVYFWSVLSGYMRTSRASEELETLDRWFSSKGLKFEGRIIYRKNDALLESPLDPFDDACFQ